MQGVGRAVRSRAPGWAPAVGACLALAFVLLLLLGFSPAPAVTSGFPDVPPPTPTTRPSPSLPPAGW